MGPFEVVMTIPPTRENLHEPNSFFNQPAGHQALFPESRGFLLVQSVGFFCFFALFLQADHTGNFHLHAVGQFVVLHTGFQFLVLRVLGHVALVEKSEFVESFSLMPPGLVGRSVQVEDRRTGRPQAGALILTGQESI